MGLNLIIKAMAVLIVTVFYPYEMAWSLPFHTPKKHLSTRRGDQTKIKGISLVAPPEPFRINPFQEIESIGAEWVSIVPYAFARKGSPVLHYDTPIQWWGERPNGVVASIRKAHENGLKVMLKPHVYIPDGWVGDLHFDTESDWLKWEEGYRNYVLKMASIAAEEQVELLCFATEFKHSILKRSAFWNSLILEVRKQYPGLLTFSANWDYFEEIPFWDQMDLIGVSAYFPLSQNRLPTVNHLRKRWKTTRRRLKTISAKYHKKVLFTEYGYLSVDYATKGHWILEPNIKRYAVNEGAQANALEALYRAFWESQWWAGGFLWKWYPNDLTYTGFPADKDYTPQGKVAIETIKKWYKYEGNTR